VATSVCLPAAGLHLPGRRHRDWRHVDPVHAAERAGQADGQVNAPGSHHHTRCGEPHHTDVMDTGKKMRFLESRQEAKFLILTTQNLSSLQVPETTPLVTRVVRFMISLGLAANPCPLIKLPKRSWQGIPSSRVVVSIIVKAHFCSETMRSQGRLQPAHTVTYFHIAVCFVEHPSARLWRRLRQCRVSLRSPLLSCSHTPEKAQSACIACFRPVHENDRPARL
jgi:hypothetical protein